MKKRILSILLAAIMLLSLIPITVSASENVTLSGTLSADTGYDDATGTFYYISKDVIYNTQTCTVQIAIKNTQNGIGTFDSDIDLKNSAILVGTTFLWFEEVQTSFVGNANGLTGSMVGKDGNTYVISLQKSTPTPGSAVYTVAGAEDLMGSEWDPTDNANNMTDMGDGSFQLVKENVVLSAGDYMYKVVSDHTWGTGDYPQDGGNKTLTIAENGTYTVTFTFVPANTDLSAIADKSGTHYTYSVTFPKGPEQVYIIGDTSNWTSFIPMTMTSDTTATITVDTQFTEYKYTAGADWAYVEKDGSGGEISNRTSYANPDVVGSWADVPAPKLTAPQVPTVAEENVKAIMCDTYTNNLGWFPKDWGGCNWSNKTISGVNFQYANTMHWDCFASDLKGAGVADYANLHFDIWFAEDGNAPVVKLEFNGDNLPTDEITIPGTFKAGWNSVNINVKDTFGEQKMMDDLKLLTVTVTKEGGPVAWANILFYNGDYTSTEATGTYAVTDGTAPDAKGTISFKKNSASEGEIVIVTVTPDKGYKLKSLKYNDGTDYEITKDKTTGEYQFKMPAKAVTVTAEFEVAESVSGEKEIFNPQNAGVDHTWGEFDDPEASWNQTTGILTIQIISQGGFQWGNEVFLDTGIKTLDTTKEYQVSFTATASTVDCGGVTFKAFDNNAIAFANQNIPLTTTPFNYVSDWKIPSSASANGLIVFDFGWDRAQTVTITNISIKERTPVHNHNLVKVTGQAATESAAGWKDYYECKDSTDACHKYFEDENGTTPIEKLGDWKAQGGRGYLALLVHTITPVSGQNATDTEAGYKSYYECKNCGKYYEDAAGLIEITDLNAWKAQGGNGYLPGGNDTICSKCGCHHHDNFFGRVFCWIVRTVRYIVTSISSILFK